METYLAIAVGVVTVILVALGLAFLSNKAEETQIQSKRPSKRERGANREKKAIKDQSKESTSAPAKKKRTKASKKPANVTFGYDGEDESDEEQSVLEFLRGTDDFKAQEAKLEKRRKARADKKAQDSKTATPGSVAKSDEDSDEDIEYVLIKRKKPSEKSTTSSKKGKKKAVAQPEAVVPEEKKKETKRLFQERSFPRTQRNRCS